VQCYLKGGVPGFVPFTVTFSASSGAVAGAGLLYAYVHDTSASVAASGNPAGGVNTVTALSPGEWPAPPGISFGTAGGVNTVTRAGLAPSLVRFPPAGLKPDTVLVTIRDPGAKVRNLSTVRATSGGSAVARDVNCCLPSGAMDATQSLVSYDTNS
jgi:hypothetical protein